MKQRRGRVKRWLFVTGVVLAPVSRGILAANAQPAMSAPASECARPEFTMLLKDGRRINGMLLEYEEGVTVSWKLRNGQVKNFRWDEIRPGSLEVLSGCSTPSMVEEAPPPSGPTPPPWKLATPPTEEEESGSGSDLLQFVFKSRPPGMKLERLWSAELRATPGGPTGEGYQVRHQEDWRPLCTAPCSGFVPRHTPLHVVGQNGVVIGSGTFKLWGQSPTQITAGPPHVNHTKGITGLAMTIAGPLCILIGPFLLASGASDREAEERRAFSWSFQAPPDYGPANRLFASGLALLMSGLVVTAVGLPLFLKNSPWKRSTRVWQNSTYPLASLGAQRTPNLFGFAF